MQETRPWFTIQAIDETTYILSEYHHWEQTHCYLLIGREKALLIDTGLGIGNIGEAVAKLTSKPVTAVATHVHWDHIGGHKHFPDFYAHKAELPWLQGQFPLPLSVVRHMVTDRCDLPDGFDINSYEIFQGSPCKLLEDGDLIDLGERTVQVLHTPGHAPGHMCFWEQGRKNLYTGDLVYRGTLFANYPSTNPEAYLKSLEKAAKLPAERIFPGHQDLDIRPELVMQMRDAFRELKREGKLHHGGGIFQYKDWSVSL